MKHNVPDFFRKLVLLLCLLTFVGVNTVTIADVGNQNRYTESSSSSSSSSSFDWSSGSSDGGSFSGGIGTWIVAFIITGFILLFSFIKSKFKKNKKGGTATTYKAPESVRKPAGPPIPSSEVDVRLIQEDDPAFSAEKFTGWAKDVFVMLQQAWTERDWKKIRPFESEELFAQHNAQLNEYIRNNKINVVEKIEVRQCYITYFRKDGDKEVVTVRLDAVMRDYVIDATTKKVLESDPNKDWYMNYELVFARKKGVKTKEGLSNKSTTNCPNCGAPIQISSAGQCEYCGSVVTTGEHDWVLTDLHSV